MSQATLAENWPNHSVNIRYVQFVENGEKKITDQNTLRDLSELLNIPLWRFGLSEYNPFNPSKLPGRGEHMYQETLDVVDHLIQQTWYMRRVAPLPETEKTAKRLLELFTYFLKYLPPPSILEPRFLRLHAQVYRLIAIMQIERKQYGEAIKSFFDMFSVAKQLGEPTTLALALMGIGVELERAGDQQEAVNRLEEARDISFNTSKRVAALVNAYLARAYASNKDALHFQRAIDTAQTLSEYLKPTEIDTDYVFHRKSGILAEKSYGYLEINEPKKTLDLQKEITRQIDLDNNAWLRAWMPLDWARAYFMLNEIEKSVEETRKFFYRASKLQSPHTINRAYEHLITLEEAGYADVKAVQDFRDELNQIHKKPKHQR